MKKSVEILNEAGLHARPAGILVKAATQFSSVIEIEYNGSTYNAKSMMKVLSMGLKKGAEISIIANGSDEEEAVEALIELIETKFGEA